MQRVKTFLSRVLRALIRPRNIATTAVSFLFIHLIQVVAFNTDALNPVARAFQGFSTTDIFYDMMLTAPADTSNAIVIVDITKLHNRDSIALALEEVDALEPAAIDIDVVFEYPKEPAGDLHLVGVAATLSNAVFSFKMMDPDRERKEFTRQVHSFFAQELGLNEGFVNVDRSMTRNIPLCLEMQGKAYPSVIARMMEVLQGEPFDYQNHKSEPIDYEPTVFRVIPFDSIQQNAQYITGKIVMFGGAYESIDMLYTPIGQKHGIEVLCYALKTMLEKKQQTNCTGWLYWLITLLIAHFAVCCIMAYRSFMGRKKEELANVQPTKAIGSPKGIAIDVFSTTFFVSMVVFLIMVAYMIVGYVLFDKWRINFDLTPALSVMALSIIANEFVHIAIKHSHNIIRYKGNTNSNS
ncbi:MAG: CHASE2 domain-containing protein [Bacteroidaceae bacterium]|nr:CHASE2 domain-containing protein [Bacteroidaceae bacterium]